MTPYRLSPYVRFIESKLNPNATQYAAFHQLTGELIQTTERLRAFLLAIKRGVLISLGDEDLNGPGPERAQLQQLVKYQFLIPNDRDPLLPFINHYVVRPIQNPAVGYVNDRGNFMLVRTSMKVFEFSPRRGQGPEILEESLPSKIASMFLLADGTRTVADIFYALGGREGTSLLEEDSFREAIEYLTHPERQLIKFSARPDNLDDPEQPCNTAPRNLYHVARWPSQPSTGAEHNLDFHIRGIQDAAWEFDFIEPTLNHAFRFPSEALGGYDYGARFCLSALTPEVLSAVGPSKELSVLEVGGGTGSFARSFINQASQLKFAKPGGLSLSYSILELSPALARHQQELLSQQGFVAPHFEQDATKFNLPGQKFDLIIANEVIADFPVASVRRTEPVGQVANGVSKWEGEGAAYLQKYDLDEPEAPPSFILNTGVFAFLERACLHLSPGGTIIMSEYGSEVAYPIQAFNLNHEEFSINFRHVKAYAAKLGLDCTLMKLKDFLEIDDEVLMLNGAAEHIQCLNHVLEKYGCSLPHAAISKEEFEKRVGDLAEKISLVGFSFSPLRVRFHYCPDLDNFLVAIMKKPSDSSLESRD
jgi:Putative S-adenosyl-L-methionine-dependent methyltransferase